MPEARHQTDPLDALDALVGHALMLADRDGDRMLGIKLSECMDHLDRRRAARHVDRAAA